MRMCLSSVDALNLLEAKVLEVSDDYLSDVLPTYTAREQAIRTLCHARNHIAKSATRETVVVENIDHD